MSILLTLFAEKTVSSRMNDLDTLIKINLTLYEVFLMESVIFLGFPDSSVDKESACNAGDPGLIPGLGKSAGEGIDYPLKHSWASLVAQMVKNPPAMWETWVRPWVGKIPWRREQLPTTVFWPGEFMGCIVHGVSRVRHG